MIGRIRGTLLEKHSNQVLVDVNGLAYEVAVPMSTLFHLPENGQTVSLHTHLVVREDAQLLYGFYELNERTLFRLLIKLNGVGPKMALGILSGLNIHELANCVRQDDVNTLVRLPGVGKKTAERLIVELRDKLTDWYQETDQLESVDSGKSSGSGYQDAESALIALGYKPQDAGKAISRAAKKLEENNQSLETSQLVRLALRDMTG
ncbi:MAG: Holliday junction branch migration protein RuvA [Gammaproteobacteria bacterium]|nr:Holliday junction branch migration protein RuvA [Gammaproteobacteria bacterium]MAY02134.1 Holliday junction branch migration protein RuvA [Gammaproteobacteria bacterium]|tara:strand:+ start:1172 stop:1789 length:618 start_codon:yes stop_codon:yes gene_type:complete